MALHTLKYWLHTLDKCADYQIDNMLVYAVYAKSKIKLFRRDIIYETFVMKYIAFPFVFPSIFRRSTLGRRLLFARTFLTSAVLTFQRG